MDFPSRTVFVEQLDLEFDVLADDAIIGPAIEKGSWADDETYLMQRHIAPGAQVLDLGANVGWFSVVAILAGANVTAFEPVPGIADVCERNMNRAMEIGRGKGVLHRVAAGAERGTAEIAIGKKNFGDNRVVEAHARPTDMGDGALVKIDIAPVDEFVSGPARFIKIDTQGSEWLALQGMKNVLAKSKQLAMLLEFWPYALRGCRPEDLLRFLDREGFTMGKATCAPYPMPVERILKQSLQRDPVKGGIDLYAARGVPFHVTSFANRLKSVWRSMKEE